MFFNFKVCLTTCFCTFKDIKWVPMNFHGTKKIIVTDGFHDLWHGTKKLLSVGFEILGLAEL